MRNTEIRCKNTKKNINTQITNVKILIFTKIFCFKVERRMKCISLPFRLSDSYNFPASLTSRFRKTVHNGSFLKLYIPSTLKFDRKAEIPPLAPFTSVLHKEQSAATVCIRQHALAETEDSLGKINMADMGRRLSCLLQTLPVYLRLSNQVVLNR